MVVTLTISRKLLHMLMNFACGIYIIYIHVWRWSNRPKHAALLYLTELLFSKVKTIYTECWFIKNNGMNSIKRTWVVIIIFSVFENAQCILTHAAKQYLILLQVLLQLWFPLRSLFNNHALTLYPVLKSLQLCLTQASFHVVTQDAHASVENHASGTRAAPDQWRRALYSVFKKHSVHTHIHTHIHTHAHTHTHIHTHI